MLSRSPSRRLRWSHWRFFCVIVGALSSSLPTAPAEVGFYSYSVSVKKWLSTLHNQCLSQEYSRQPQCRHTATGSCTLSAGRIARNLQRRPPFESGGRKTAACRSRGSAAVPRRSDPRRGHAERARCSWRTRRWRSMERTLDRRHPAAGSSCRPVDAPTTRFGRGRRPTRQLVPVASRHVMSTTSAAINRFTLVHE